MTNKIPCCAVSLSGEKNVRYSKLTIDVYFKERKLEISHKRNILIIGLKWKQKKSE
jgi:hypothetical protein